MGRSSEAYLAQQERDEAIREASSELLISGKHLALKLAEIYSAAGADPTMCPAIQQWAKAVVAAEGRC